MRSRTLALEIAGRDLDRALDDAPMPIDAVFQGADAFGDLGDGVGSPVCWRNRNDGARLDCDDTQLVAQGVGDLLDRGGLQAVQLLKKSEEQQARAEGIDLARHPAGMPIDEGKAILGELRIAFPIGAAQPVLDIGFGLAFAQRPEMIGGGDPLSQLLEPRAAEHSAELWLPEQE